MRGSPPPGIIGALLDSTRADRIEETGSMVDPVCVVDPVFSHGARG